MKKISVAAFLLVIVLGFFDVLILMRLKDAERIYEYFEREMTEKFSLQDEKLNLMSEEFSKLYEKLEAVSDDIKKISRNSEGTQKKIVNLNRTYSEILDEQKKKTVDVTKTDSAVTKMKDEAASDYKDGNYSSCYQKSKSVLVINSGDLEARRYMVLSCYKMNPMDSSKYEEILNDIEVLRQNGSLTEELSEIENIVRAERGME